MGSLKVVSDRADDNSITLRVVLPPRRNGEPNYAALTALNSAVLTVNPVAYDPEPLVLGTHPPTAPEIAAADGHTATGAGLVPEMIAIARQRDLPPDEDEVVFPRACPAGGCGED